MIPVCAVRVSPTRTKGVEVGPTGVWGATPGVETEGISSENTDIANDANLSPSEFKKLL